MHSITIIPRYCGPDDSGNGGYVAGLLAQELEGPVRVRLKAPPPLEKELSIVPCGKGVELRLDDQCVAAAEPTELQEPPPAAPSLASARKAQQHYVGFHEHPYRGCFVCGPERREGDGLRIFPGACEEQGELLAASWQPGRDLLDVMGKLQPEFVWAGLDCPGYFAAARPGENCLLGEMSAVIHEEVPGDRPLISYAWSRGREGRKLYAGTAIADEDGKIYAQSEQTWIVT